MKALYSRVRARTLVFMVVLSIAVFAAALWHVVPQTRDSTIPPSQELPPIATHTIHEGVAGEGVREYANTDYRFSLSYPQSLTVTEYTEANDAISITFEDYSDSEMGFQIYVTPYKLDHITDERFRLDAPSGVKKKPIEVVVDGTRSVIFFSENALMGETREVWFIKNGFLYEVATYKALDTWLAGIMKTWKFLATAPTSSVPTQ